MEGRETVFWAVKRLGHTFGFYIKKLGFPVVSPWFYHRLKEVPGQHLTCLDRRSNEVLPPERKPRARRTCFLTEVKNVNSGLVNSWLIDSMGISGSQNGTVPCEAIFCWDIPLHRPYTWQVPPI